MSPFDFGRRLRGIDPLSENAAAAPRNPHTSVSRRRLLSRCPDLLISRSVAQPSLQSHLVRRYLYFSICPRPADKALRRVIAPDRKAISKYYTIIPTIMSVLYLHRKRVFITCAHVIPPLVNIFRFFVSYRRLAPPAENVEKFMSPTLLVNPCFTT